MMKSASAIVLGLGMSSMIGLSMSCRSLAAGQVATVTGAGATGGDHDVAVAAFRIECTGHLKQEALEIEKDEVKVFTFNETNYMHSTGPGANGFAISVVPFGKPEVPQRLQVVVELNGETKEGTYTGIESSVATSGDLNTVSTTLRMKTESEFPDVLRRRTLQITCKDLSLIKSNP